MLAIKGGKVFTVTGETYENGIVLIDEGKIVAVGTDVCIPEGAEIIDAAGKWVTPGFIDPHTHLCTFGEPGTMPGISDGNEITNPVTSHIRAFDAFHPFDQALPQVRQAGFTTCCTLPGSANIIGGTGFAFKLKDGETVFDMAIPGTEYMKMALGENPRRCYSAKNVIPSTRMGNGAVLREALYNAKVYSDAKKAAETDPSKAPKPDFKLESLVPVVRGEMRCRIHSHRADDIVTAVRIAEEFGLDYAIEHCTEGYKIKDFLAEKGMFCTIGPLLMGPSKMEIWGCRQDTPAILNEAGVNVCLTADTGSATKWLPMHIGICMTQGGLKFEDALKGVTINPAKLLQIEERVGSIEAGKDADIAIWNGNPFSNMTLCEKTIIEGVVYDR